MAGSNGAAQRQSLFLRFAQEIVWQLGLLIYRRWYRLRVHGIEHLPCGGPYLLVANHASHLDGPAIIAAQGIHYRTVYSLGARDYFFRTPAFSWIARHILNMVPIDRRRVDFEVLARCRRIARAGGILIIFPEGTRSKDGRIQPFKSGFGLLALRLGLPVVPVYIAGTYGALPKGRLLPRRSRISVTFGSVIHLRPEAGGGQSSRAAYQRIGEEMRRTIEALRESGAPPAVVPHLSHGAGPLVAP